MKHDAHIEGVVPTEQMVGEDDEESSELQALLREARSYLTKFSWCRGIREEFFGLGVGRVVGVFLFEATVSAGVDSRLWVIVGDLPNAYLVTDQAHSSTAALRVYCDLMDDWIRAVRDGGDLSNVFPVAVPPTKNNADKLEKRVRLLREEILPSFEDPEHS